MCKYKSTSISTLNPFSLLYPPRPPPHPSPFTTSSSTPSHSTPSPPTPFSYTPSLPLLYPLPHPSPSLSTPFLLDPSLSTRRLAVCQSHPNGPQVHKTKPVQSLNGLLTKNTIARLSKISQRWAYFSAERLSTHPNCKLLTVLSRGHTCSNIEPKRWSEANRCLLFNAYRHLLTLAMHFYAVFNSKHICWLLLAFDWTIFRLPSNAIFACGSNSR